MDSDKIKVMTGIKTDAAFAKSVSSYWQVSTLLLLSFNHFHIVFILRVPADKIVLLLN